MYIWREKSSTKWIITPIVVQTAENITISTPEQTRNQNQSRTFFTSSVQAKYSSTADICDGSKVGGSGVVISHHTMEWSVRGGPPYMEPLEDLVWTLPSLLNIIEVQLCLRHLQTQKLMQIQGQTMELQPQPANYCRFKDELGLDKKGCWLFFKFKNVQPLF